MFDYLSKNLGKVFEALKKKGVLTESDINTALREIRIALIEADVALPAIKHLIEQIKVKALGTEVLSSITPGQMIIKIVHDELVSMLQSDKTDLKLNYTTPIVFVMVGLQGAGKTTTTAKLALHLRQKYKKKVLLASTDTRRPAAQKQLEVLGKQINIETLPIVEKDTALQITNKALSAAKSGNYDVLIVDTAGRLSIDEELMLELNAICKIAGPQEILLVADCMIGQDSVNVAKAFNEQVSLSGIILTKTEGDARGGAALSMKFITGCPIKLIGVGEKVNDLEEFKAESIASRILNMGDIVSLVEKMKDIVDAKESEKLAKKLQKGKFDMNDLLAQLKTMKKLGGVGSLIGMIPGFGKLKASAEQIKQGEEMFKRQEAIIFSMTDFERRNPKLINPSRKNRIARGSGTSIQEVNRLLKQYLDMNNMIKKMSNMDPSNLKRLGSKFMY
ncbi:MAG: signal recognition particle protein [Candidatus Midichloria sp.]|uniref:Signal recognition particle subunit SRP54 n=1 Tax=Hyalomma marginatum TaxID=34627 RepID=A0A8S4C3K4_9ACAR|nr:signal recognition particle protein [Hyalomma marginatum]CAG7600683.1 signal recognition particle protein [Hyalomma marginatum]